MLDGLDSDGQDQARGALRSTMEMHAEVGGVTLGSAAWLVSAAPATRRSLGKARAVDEGMALAAFKHYLDTQDQDVAHEIYHEDAVLDFPQSGERFDGVESFKAWRRIYPAHVDYELRRFRGRDDFWVAELVLHYDGGPPYYGVSILEFRGDKVAHETIYGGDAWEAPEWRAPYRSDSSDVAEPRRSDPAGTGEQ